MAGFDVSDAPLRAGPGDALESVSRIADIQNKFNQNRLFQAQTRAGQYLAQSLGPDGQPDAGKFGSLLAGDPVTAPYNAEALLGERTIQHGGIQNVTAQTNLASLRYQNMQNDDANAYSAAYSAAKSANPSADPSTWDDAGQKASITALARGAAQGRYNPDEVSNYYGRGDFRTNSSRMAVISGQGGTGAQEAYTGKPTPVQTGQGTQFENVNLYSGGPGSVEPMGGSTGGFVQNKLSPTDLATSVDVVDPITNAKSKHTLGEYLNQDGTWKPGVEHPIIDAGPLSTSTRTFLGQAYGHDINDFEKEAENAPTTKQYIGEMRKAGDSFDSGPNSQFWQRFGELANEYHVNIDKNNVKTAAREEFQKVYPQLLRAQATALGMNETDAGRLTASAAIPDQATTPQGRDHLLGLLEGMEDMKIAEGKAWDRQKSTYGPETFGTFRMKFPQHFDPTIFQSQYMSPQDISAMQKGWSSDKRTQWERSRQVAQQQGWIK